MNLQFILQKREKTFRTLASALDPMVYSVTTLVIQGVVLWTANKVEFGTFSLSYSYVIMGQTVLSALFGAPLVTLLGNVDTPEGRRRVGEAILRYQIFVAVLIGALGFGVAFALRVPPLIAILDIVGFVGLSFRDALRSVLVAQYRLNYALAIALIFAIVTVVTLAAMYMKFGRVSAIGGLSALAVGAALTLSTQMVRSLFNRESLSRKVLLNIAGMATWSLPGAAVIWLQNSFYLTLVAITLDLGAVAEVSSARMTIMPILTTTSGLLRLLQVQASRMLANGDLAQAVGIARRLAGLTLWSGFGLVSIQLGLHAVVPHNWLPHHYPHILLLSAAWIIFATATTARGIYTSLFQAMGRYREMFIYNMAFAPFALIGVMLAPMAIGLVGAILPMAIAEFLLFGVLAWRALKISSC